MNKYGASSRASPFRRAESPSSPSAPKYQPNSPSKLQNSSIFNDDGTWSPSLQKARALTARDAPTSPPRAEGTGARTLQPTASLSGGNKSWNADALAKLPPAQVREMREAFQILDRNSDGFVDREDVTDMLGQLGLDNGPAASSAFFPPQTQHPLSMAAYLSSLSTSLAQMSPPNELLAALSAFDDDDSGQVDVKELADALTHTSQEPGDTRKPLSSMEVAQVMQEFAGKRAFSKHSTTSSLNRGDVFRYREWVSSLQAVGGQNEKIQAA